MLLAFHNDKEVKKKYVSRLEAHAKADAIIQGTGWDGKKGCAVGCTLENYSHSAYETELGIPEWLALLEDKIFEGLTKEDSKSFPLNFLQAIPVGVDLEPVKWKFCAFILKENIERVLSLTIEDDLKKQVVGAVRGCLSLHENAIKTGVWDTSAARSAASAASAARSAASAARSAASAAWSTEDAAWSAASAARSAESAAGAASAAWSTEDAAWSAARSAESAASAAWSAERSAAWSASYKRYADELIRILKDLQPPRAAKLKSEEL